MISSRFGIGYGPSNEWLRRRSDPERYRALFRVAGIGAVALGVLLIAYWPRQEAVRLGYRTEALRIERDRLERDIQSVRLRLDELGDPQRVQRLAREQFELGLPTTVATLGGAGR